MPIKKLASGDNLELLLSGRVDGPAAHELEVEILAAIRAGTKNIYVNLAEADFLCSAGIRVLLQYHRQLKQAGKTLRAVHPSPNVRAALDMTGLPGLVEAEG